ncbi:hypothetical protein JCM9279_002883 [Rhodotorula babjevae]
MSAHSPSSALSTASLPGPVLAPSTPRPAPARRAKASDGSTSDELARAEVLELTLFAEKKVWIEDKVKFLSTLPPIEVVSPEPPRPAAASRAELDAWWTEHDRIEAEVDDYDMGDLARMRLFARDKSKQALSPRDTDLIEITLTTLFAVDRLLHLLRQRRKALTLLGYRLQWEDAVSTARTAQRQILADLPTFLTNVAWAPPTSVGPLARRATADVAALSTSPSLSSLSSSRSLALLAAPTTFSPSTPSLRSSTRTHLVSIQHSALSTLAHQLLASLVPASATALDKLIDASPQPLPEPFLDEQDRLEADCGAAATGLREFLDGTSAQRTLADALAADAASVSARAVAAAGAGDPPALVELRVRALPALYDALVRLPAPTHALAPAQRAANDVVRSALAGLVGAAEEAVERAEGRARAEEQLDEVGQRARAARERLDGLEARWRAHVDQAPRGIVETASMSQEERDREAALGPLEQELRAALAEARAVQPDAARVVVVAREAGVPRERVRAVRGEAEELAALVGGLEQRVEGEERRREGRTAARELLHALECVRVRHEEGVQALSVEARRSRWTPAAQDGDEAALSPSRILDDIRLAQAALLTPALARADALAAAGRPAPLGSPAAELVGALRDDTTAALEPLERLCSRASRQNLAVQALDGELGAIESDLARFADEVEALHDRPDSPSAPLEERLAMCATSLERLTSSAHARVPLLAGSAPAAGRSEPPFDLAEQDAAVRSYVNERCARARASVDEVRRSVGEVEHGREAGLWDEAVERLEREVAAVERELDGADEAVVTELLSRLDILSNSLLSSTSSSLSHLLSGPHALGPRFATMHADRRARLDSVVARSTAAHDSLVAAQAERRAQRAALLVALVDQAEVFTAIAGDAEHARSDAEDAGAALASSRDALLGSADLDEHSTLDCSALERLELVIASLHERVAESEMALDALREQASSSSADAEVRAAVSAAVAAASACRAVVQTVDAPLSHLQKVHLSWPAARDEALQSRRGAAAAAAPEVVVVADPHVGRDEPGVLPASQAVDECVAGEERLAAASSTLAPPEQHSTSPSEASSAPVVVQPTTPSPPYICQRSLGSLIPPSHEHGADAADDPFSLDPRVDEPFGLDASGFDEPLAVVHLRRRMQKATAREWLDAETVLQLPSAADAAELERLVAGCRTGLDGIARLPHEQLLWTDLDALKAEQQSKETAAARVRALAGFAEQVVSADAALSDLLIAVDAATPSATAPSPEPGSAPALSLADALVAASEAVTAVRVGAIPVVDDARVARAIERIEEGWAELLGLVEDRYTPSRNLSHAISSIVAGVDPHPERLVKIQLSCVVVGLNPLASPVQRCVLDTARPRQQLRRAADAACIQAQRSGVEGDAEIEPPRAERAPCRDASPGPLYSSKADVDFRTALLLRHTYSFELVSVDVDAVERRAPQPRHVDSPRQLGLERLDSPHKLELGVIHRDQHPLQPSKTEDAAGQLYAINPATAHTRTPRPSIAPTTPPSRRSDRAQPYSANVHNKLDREVGSIINALPQHVQVPIRVADGKWTDESGVYNIGGRLYFCRILRSKQVMVRVGGGWLSLLQFLITHFGQVDGLTISPSTSLSKTLGTSKSQWMSTDSTRSQLSASTSGNSLRDLLASSASSTALSDLGSSTSSTPLRRSLSGHVEVLPSPRRPRCSDVGLSTAPSPGPRSAAPAPPRAPRTPRPPVPIWRP